MIFRKPAFAFFIFHFSFHIFHFYGNFICKWTALRQNIETIRQQNNLPETAFKPVDLHTWQDIEKNIYQTFCRTQHETRTWLWQDFKLDTHSIQYNRNYPFDEILKLVDPSEKVWLIINDRHNEKTKYWYYEGLIETIVFVLGESMVDEVYIAAKNYDWLLCINHHDQLIATGKNMPEKLRQLESSNS